MKYNVIMNKVKLFFILGVLVAVLPFSGFPYSVQDSIYVVIGLVIIFISYLSYRDLKVGESNEKNFDNFSENTDFNEKEAKTEEIVEKDDFKNKEI